MDVFNKNYSSVNILVAPLDWGLGHATRCIPIITALLENGCNVIIAADGKVKNILQKEFPQLECITLKGYNISYARKGWMLPLTIFLQIPKILLAIYKENRWLKKISADYHLHMVISDNRYGLYNKSLTSVFIIHQLYIKARFVWMEKIIQQIHNRFLSRFTYCWVPDFSGKENLAGVLSHPEVVLPNVSYIGGLSRMESQPSVTQRYDYCIILSGPEPQRSIFERKIVEELKSAQLKVLLVRGLPGEDVKPLNIDNKNVHIANHLSARDLNAAIVASGFVISRCGYTTVMDLVKLKKKAVLVPTPGQTEQEYLANYLEQKKYFYTIPQHLFNLQAAVYAVDKQEYLVPEFDMTIYKMKVAELLNH